MQTSTAFPRMRWLMLLWLAVWFPTYAWMWGWGNFLQLCNISVLITVLGFWWRSPLLLSSQAVGGTVINCVWALDAGWRLFFGHHLLGGTEYMWDARFPLWVRLLSAYHVAMPPLLLWALRRTGYDRRGFWLQSALSVPVLLASRLLNPAKNVNFAFVDPVLHHAFRPAALHLALILIPLLAVVYWPTHKLLARAYAPARKSTAGPRA